MRFAVLAPTVESVGGILAQRRRGAEGVFDFMEAEAADARGRAGEAAVDDFLGEPDRLEQLRRTIGPERRNAHFRHDFEEPLVHRLDVVRRRGDLVLREERRDGGEREVGIDGGRAVAEQHGEMVDFAHLAGFDDQPDGRPHPRLDQRMVHGGRGEKDGDGWA